MNRRRFTQSLVALFSMPMLPALPAISMASATTAVAVPVRAQSWAIYMSSLHGQCTPQALQSVLNIPATDAKRYVTQLIADGVIKPNPILKSAISDVVKDRKENLLDKFKKRAEMKSKTQIREENFEVKSETADQIDDVQISQEVELETIGELDENLVDKNNADEPTPLPSNVA